jgi:ribosomal protein S18 acetylase RimI-like enzyme
MRVILKRVVAMVPSADLRRIPPGETRKQFMPLLLLADESEQQVRSYINEGELYVFDEAGGVAGVILAIPRGTGDVELKAVAVEAIRQGRGVGTRMIRAVLDDLRQRGVRRALVGTSNAAIGQLAYYQKAGFRLLSIERDFFSPARGYPAVMEENGIRLCDMVWMDQVLAPSDRA